LATVRERALKGTPNDLPCDTGFPARAEQSPPSGHAHHRSGKPDFWHIRVYPFASVASRRLCGGSCIPRV